MTETANETILEIRILNDIVSRKVRREAEQRLNQVKSRFNSLQHSVLRLLSCREYTIAELGRRLAHDPATLVQAVDDLESEGLLKRGQDPKDRRRTPLTLTPQGRVMVSLTPALNQDEVFVRSLNELGREKAEQLLTLLREVALAMASDKEAVQELPSNVRQILKNTRSDTTVNTSGSVQE